MNESDHALSLLRDLADDWDGRCAIIPVDPVCRFGATVGTPCNVALHGAVVLRARDERAVHLLALCEHHVGVMRRAVDTWRSRS